MGTPADQDADMTEPHRPLTDHAALLAAVRASGVLSAAQFDRAAAALPPAATCARQAAQSLVAAGFLTRFQADRLLAGKPDGFVLDPYVIQEQLGGGAAGRVYRAVHRTMRRAVAIKVLGAELTGTAAARQVVRAELRAAAKLNHPNVVTALDAGEVRGRPYLVSEFVAGPTAAALVADRGPLPAAEAAELVRQAALGLQHAHDHGMVHGAVAPRNLFVARVSKTLPGCVVKVADFGVARLAAAAAADYTAPDAAPDHRADLYSLGGVFYFLLTGRPPAAGAPVPVEQLRPDVPPAVAELVARLLATDPAARVQTAAEVAARLNGLATGTGVSFELPAGYPSGVQPPPAPRATGPGDGLSDTCLWAQLTAEVAAANTADETAATPVPARLLRVPARPAGVSRVAILILIGAVAAACLLAAGLLLRAVAN